MNDTAFGIASLVMSAIFAWWIRRCFKTGQADPNHYLKADRRTQPRLFWMMISLYSFFAVACFIGGLDHLLTG